MPRDPRRSSLACALALAVSTTAGCAVHSVERDRPPVLATPMPERFAELEAEGEPASERFWTLFGDAELDALVSLALADNLDLRRATARIAQAEALVRAAESGQLPAIQAQAGVGGNRTVINIGPPIGVRSNEFANYSVGVSVAYEVDLFGRIGHGVDAATLDVTAGREDLAALSLSIAARVTDLYFQAVGERALIDLLTAQEASTAKVVSLVELRFSQGLSAIVDVYQQRQQLATLQAQRPLAEARLALVRHQLATLLGRPPSSLSLADLRALPDPPPPPRAGIPADLLMRRPDVRAALHRVAAADHRVGAAIAARYPALNLSASTGFQSPDLVELFQRWVWSLAANLVAPLFDGGRRSAEVERSEAVLNELVAVYAQVTLTALTEVESALAQEKRQREHVERLLAQLELAHLGYAEAETRYLNGLSTYLEVLTAQRTLQQSEQTLLQARRQLLAHRVQLHRALGGTWMTATVSPSPAPAASSPPSPNPPAGPTPERGDP